MSASAVVRDYRQYYYGSSEQRIVHLWLLARCPLLTGRAAYWLSVVLCPVMVMRTPCWVTDTFWIATPAGSFGMLTLKSARLPSTDVGIPASVDDLDVDLIRS